MKVQKTTVRWLAIIAGVVLGLFVWGRRSGPTSVATDVTVPGASSTIITPTNFGENTDLTFATTSSGNSISAAPDALAAALAAIESESNPGRQSAALIKLVEGMPMAEVPSALTSSAGKSGRLSSEFRQMLIRRWAKMDAPAAADWIDRNLTGPNRASALNAAASTWAEADAAGAEQWARRLMDPDERGNSLLAIAGEMTGRDPAAALSLAVDLPPGLARDEFLQHAAGEWAGRDARSAIEWGQQIQNEELRAQMLAAIATGFAEKDPAAAATLAAQSLPAGRVQDDAVVGIVQRWVQQEPAQAAAWVAAFPEGKLHDTALEALVRLWADKDLTEAGAWVNSLSERAGSDVAIAAYVEKMAVQFPEMALEWAQEIRNPVLRDERLVHLAELWLHSDAPAARQWISQSALSGETKARLLAPRPK